MIRCSVILPAAGRGSRFASGVGAKAGVAAASKIEWELEGRAVFLRAIDLFHGRPEVEQIVLAVAPSRFDEFMFRWGEALKFLGVEVVRGGKTERWETVAQALKHVREGATHVAVHDAARPTTPKAVIDRVFAAAETSDAVIPGLPVADTLKRLTDGAAPKKSRDRIDDILGVVEPEAEATLGTTDPAPNDREIGVVDRTVTREGLVTVQTPQVFGVQTLRRAYGTLDTLGASTEVTDDAGLVEAMGGEVVVVAGDPGNLKLTRPEDAEMLSALFRFRDAEAKRADAVKALFGDDEED
ncbi:MAG: IspD/TarI family cytidylyltransferase [Planctomycetota bacterium]